MKKIAIISFFMSSNIGDCILSSCLYKQFSEFYKCYKITYSLNPFEYSNLDNISEIKLNRYAYLKKFILQILTSLKLFSIIQRYYWKKNYHHKNDYIRIESIIKESHLVMIGGGNMIFDLTRSTLSAGRFYYFVKLAKKLSKPIIACSIGIGPFADLNQYKKAIYALQLVDFITFRDKNSYKIYRQLSNKNNCTISSDPAFLFDNISFFRNRTFIGLNIIDPNCFTTEKYIKDEINFFYIELSKKIIEKGYKLVVFVTDIRDYKFAEKVYLNIYQNIEIHNMNSLEKIKKVYSSIALLIGSRMHSLILAYTQLIPIIGLSWQIKVNALFDELKMSDFVYPLQQKFIQKIMVDVENILNNKTIQTVPYIENQLALRRKLLEKNLMIATRLLKI